jgi:hypothetical protein
MRSDADPIVRDRHTNSVRFRPADGSNRITDAGMPTSRAWLFAVLERHQQPATPAIDGADAQVARLPDPDGGRSHQENHGLVPAGTPSQQLNSGDGAGQTTVSVTCIPRQPDIAIGWCDVLPQQPPYPTSAGFGEGFDL